MIQGCPSFFPILLLMRRLRAVSAFTVHSKERRKQSFTATEIDDRSVIVEGRVASDTQEL